MIEALAALAVLAPPPELVEIRDGVRPCKQLRAVYRDGDERVGTTELRVFGRWARLVRTEPGADEPAIYKGSVPEKLCRRLLRRATENKLWKARSKRKRAVDDETRPSIALGVKHLGRFRVKMFGFDVQNDTAFATSRATLIYIVRRLSDNEIRW